VECADGLPGIMLGADHGNHRDETLLRDDQRNRASPADGLSAILKTKSEVRRETTP